MPPWEAMASISSIVGCSRSSSGDEVLGGAPLGDVVDLGLGAVDDLGDVGAVGAGVAVLHDAGAGLDEAAQQRLLRDDARRSTRRWPRSAPSRSGCADRARRRCGAAARGGPVRRPPSPRRRAHRGRTDRGSRRRRSGVRAGRSRRAAAAPARRRWRPCSAACRRAPPVRPPCPAAAGDRSPRWAAGRPCRTGRGRPRQPRSVPPPLAHESNVHSTSRPSTVGQTTDIYHLGADPRHESAPGDGHTLDVAGGAANRPCS